MSENCFEYAKQSNNNNKSYIRVPFKKLVDNVQEQKSIKAQENNNKSTINSR